MGHALGTWIPAVIIFGMPAIWLVLGFLARNRY
jgi:hypothetical protein